MTDIFAAGHRQLLEAQCSGIAAAWRRAAEEALRQAATDHAAAQPLLEGQPARSALSQSTGAARRPSPFMGARHEPC